MCMHVHDVVWGVCVCVICVYMRRHIGCVHMHVYVVCV